MKKSIGKLLLNIPGVHTLAEKIYLSRFPGSAWYWEQRYRKGGNSGGGSYSNLANFKAEFLNRFVKEHHLHSVIEFGCGDGNQLSLAQYPQYLGLDVSPTIIRHCMRQFSGDKTKSFYVYDSLSFCDHAGLFQADLTLSLDVIYHLLEDEIFEAYMHQLFKAGKQYVIIYSSNYDTPKTYHERDRKFTDWVEKNITGWKLIETVPNPFPPIPGQGLSTSKADFFIYGRG